jgi:hypothetical protein
LPLKIDPQHGSEFSKKEIYFSLFRIEMSSARDSLHISGVWRLFVSLEIPNMIRLPLFEIASVLVRFNYVASFVVYANHSVM